MAEEHEWVVDPLACATDGLGRFLWHCPGCGSHVLSVQAPASDGGFVAATYGNGVGRKTVHLRALVGGERLFRDRRTVLTSDAFLPSDCRAAMVASVMGS